MTTPFVNKDHIAPFLAKSQGKRKEEKDI